VVFRRHLRRSKGGVTSAAGSASTYPTGGTRQLGVSRQPGQAKAGGHLDLGYDEITGSRTRASNIAATGCAIPGIGCGRQIPAAF